MAIADNALVAVPDVLGVRFWPRAAACDKKCYLAAVIIGDEPLRVSTALKMRVQYQL